MFTISRSQRWCLKNRTSTPTTTATWSEDVKHDDCSASHHFILVCTMLDRLTCRLPLIRALGSAATEGWPRVRGGYACALREQYQSRGKASRSARTR